MKITQMTAKFGCYVKHSSLQKGVFRHKIVKTLRKGINHPPRCKQKTKRRLFCVAVPLGTCRQRNRGENRQGGTQNTKSYRLGTTESFSLLPLPLLQTRCQTLALHPEQKAFACRRLPIRHIQNACVLPTDFGQTLKRQLSAHLRNSLTSKKFCAERMQRQGNSQKNLPHRGKIFSQVVFLQVVCWYTNCV